MKKEHSWARGYHRRKNDKQLENTKRQLTKIKKKQPPEVRKGSLKGMKQNDQQLQNLTEDVQEAHMEAKVYKNMYEAEKQMKEAYKMERNFLIKDMRYLQKQQRIYFWFSISVVLLLSSLLAFWNH
ncbi:hypothetical protein [Neobacillus sp. NPDC093127]|uniref:hypothetical protein n=1 Tax=Neobacillus sp. NPDC093127 TaxID=3364296 RepID=UPI0038215801